MNLENKKIMDLKNLELLLRQLDLNFFLLLDAAKENNLFGLIYQQEDNPNVYPIYLGTIYEEILDVGPCLLEINCNSWFWKWYINEGTEKQNGIILSSSVPINELAKHLQKILEISLPNEEINLWRFYDPKVLAYADQIIANKRPILQGPIKDFIYARPKKNTGLLFKNIFSEPMSFILDEPTKVHDGMPIIRLNKDELQILYSGADKILLNNIVFFLFSKGLNIDTDRCLEDANDALDLGRDLNLINASSIATLALVLNIFDCLPNVIRERLDDKQLSEPTKRMLMEDYIDMHKRGVL